MNTEQSNKLRNTQRQETRVTRFYRSFSGTDALVFAILPQTEPVLIGSISTLSYSMYRDKKPVPVIGKVNMGGYTRGVRLYAGTMIFTLINQHWINELKDAIPWIDNVGVQKIDELPLMDLMVVCANEYGAAMQMMLYGVEVTEEGQVISIENLFTENTFSFVARDLSNFSNNILDGKGNQGKIEPMVKYNQFGITQLQTNFTPTYTQGPYELNHRHDFTPSYLVANDEIKDVQNKLNHPSLTEDRPPLIENGWYDSYTFEAVKDFQSQAGLAVTGELDDETYERLTYWIESADRGELDKVIANTVKTTVVHRSEGAIVKLEPNFKSDTVYTYPPKEQLRILAEEENWILTHKGYVPKPLLQFNGNSAQSFSPIFKGDVQPGNLIADIQQGLEIEVTGRFDEQTEQAIRQFQTEHQLSETGYIDEVTWLALKETVVENPSDEIYHDFVDVTLSTPTGLVKESYENLIQLLDQYNVTVHAKTKTALKVGTIAKYQNNEYEASVQEVQLKPEETRIVSLSEYASCLMYHTKYQSTPVRLEFVIHISEQVTYKWYFEIKKGVYHV